MFQCVLLFLICIPINRNILSIFHIFYDVRTKKIKIVLPDIIIYYYDVYMLVVNNVHYCMQWVKRCCSSQKEISNEGGKEYCMSIKHDVFI